MSEYTAPVLPVQGVPEIGTRHSGRAIALAIAAAVGGFLFGFDSSVINGAVNAIENRFNINPTVTGLVVAIALLGCALGAWLGGRLADRWGRTRVMLLGGILFLISSILSAFSTSALMLGIWRSLAGIGIGIASVIAPAYIAEIAPPSIRGRLGSLQQLAITLGIFAALLSDQLLATTVANRFGGGGAAAHIWGGLQAWQWMFLVCAIPALIYCILALVMPESPRYLVAQGQDERARQILASVADPGTDVDEQMDTIRESVHSDDGRTEKGALRGSALGLKPIVWVGILLSVFQQAVGINVIFYYSTTLWHAVGFGEEQSFMISTITAVTNVLVTLIAIALVDRVGRRPLLLIGSAGMAITLGLMALSFTHSVGVGEDLTLTQPWGTIALIAANLFVVFFGATWGPLVWVLLGEMFPNAIRAGALGVAAAMQWIANFAITLSFPPMLRAFGATVPYLMYALFAALSFFFVWKFVAETKGRSLEDMNGELMVNP